MLPARGGGSDWGLGRTYCLTFLRHRTGKNTSQQSDVPVGPSGNKVNDSGLRYSPRWGVPLPPGMPADVGCLTDRAASRPPLLQRRVTATR